MALWKTIAQNVLSGCVGALLVMGTAQAQKTGIADEIQTRRLVIVDDNQSPLIKLYTYKDSAELEMKTGDSFVRLGTSKSSGPRLALGASNDDGAQLVVDDYRSGLSLFRRQYRADLDANQIMSQLRLSKYDREPASTAQNPVLDRAKAKTTTTLMATVQGDSSTILTGGQVSGHRVLDEFCKPCGAFEWDSSKNSVGIVFREKSGRLGRIQLPSENRAMQ